jgi:hypothetical protein
LESWIVPKFLEIELLLLGGSKLLLVVELSLRLLWLAGLSLGSKLLRGKLLL